MAEEVLSNCYSNVKFLNSKYADEIMKKIYQCARLPGQMDSCQDRRTAGRFISTHSCLYTVRSRLPTWMDFRMRRNTNTSEV